MKILLTVILIILEAFYLCDGSKILVIFPMPGYSHKILGDSYVKHLLKAEHEVTYITPYPSLDSNKKLRQIDVSATSIFVGEFPTIEDTVMKGDDYENMRDILHHMTGIARRTIENQNVQILLSDPKEHFDLVIAEWLFNEIFAGLSTVYDCPLIWTTSTHLHWMILRLGEATGNPEYFPPTHSRNVAPYTKFQLLCETSERIKDYILKNGEFYEKEKECYDKYIVPILKQHNKPTPVYNDISLNASLVLSSSHPLLVEAMPLPPNFITIGGYHIDDENEVLADKRLLEIMDNAANGIIYFSMGSFLDTKEFPIVVKNNIMKIFAEMKQTIIWKTEEKFQDIPDNVHILPWVQQKSVLSHPSCLLFITHGGFLSMTEALHFGVPVIGIPVYGDHFANIANAERQGFGKAVTLTYKLADDLKTTIGELLTDTRYQLRIAELSKMYHDQPISPGRKFLYWVDYVIRTQGGRHLRSPSLLISWYELVYLDIVGSFAAVMIAVKLLVRWILSRKKITNTRNKTE